MCCWLDYLLVVGEGGIWIIKFNVFMDMFIFKKIYIVVRDKIILCIIRKRMVEVFGSVV